ncbi:NADH dehydrogenase [ubiquinone] 1 alpha subcomplex subunit 13-like [Liolophura sinensis]|uniref:NADH dehydrogenase [ubiquinone] 1 alpha subcomplex subunit 13-like n=1 Tax=Liolophura sinensis TaxID=3198878 RepID=UPI0031589885
MATKYKQDMPPRSGYGPIEWAKKIPKKGMSGFAMFGAFLGVNAFTWSYAFFKLQEVKKMNLEVTESRIALEPLIMAEKHRMLMKQFRMIRDEENELMKDYPGWETGKLFDEPIFHNPRGRFILPGWYEYYIHSSWWDLYDRVYEKRYH